MRGETKRKPDNTRKPTGFKPHKAQDMVAKLQEEQAEKRAVLDAQIDDEKREELQHRQNCKEKDSAGKFRRNRVCTDKQLEVIQDLVWGDEEPIRHRLKRLGVPKSTYYDWFTQDVFVEALAKERTRYFNAMSTKAIRKLKMLLDCEDSRTALKAVQLILQENGHLLSQKETPKNPTEINITLVDNRDE